MSSLIYVQGHGARALGCRFIFVGEAPGKQEELQGKPFVGRSGQYLREACSLFAINELNSYFTNVVKIRPKNNRSPTKEELDSWIEPLVNEVSFIQEWYPKVKIVAVGKSAEYALQSAGFMFSSIIHPSYALRFNKTKEFEDSIKEIINSTE
jgi:DNA polymerase